MARLLPRRNKPAGSPPGTVVYSGLRSGPVTISVIDYTPDAIREETGVTLARALEFGDATSVTWINIDGVHDERLIAEVGDHFGLHPLVQEDIVSPEQRPKADPDGQHIFVVLRMIQFDHELVQLRSEQISIVIGPRYVITFQETPGDVFDALRERIRGGGSRVRRRGSGYLGYAIIDAIVDHYFVVVDSIGDVTDRLEEELLTDASPGAQTRIYDLRRLLIQLRRSVWPVRELLISLERMDSVPLDREIQPFLRDLNDHLSLIIEAIEALKDSTTGLLEFHHSSLTNRANEIMKTLTIIASLFIPLTFIAGVYGMNFEHMPELGWPLAYPAVIGVMFVIAIGLLLMFKRKNWF